MRANPSQSLYLPLRASGARQEFSILYSHLNPLKRVEQSPSSESHLTQIKSESMGLQPKTSLLRATGAKCFNFLLGLYYNGKSHTDISRLYSSTCMFLPCGHPFSLKFLGEVCVFCFNVISHSNMMGRLSKHFPHFPFALNKHRTILNHSRLKHQVSSRWPPDI